MSLNKPRDLLTPAERQKEQEQLTDSERYGSPRRVWVEDGHVFVEAHDGAIVSMTPEVAIEMGRLLSQAGSDSLINRVMDGGAEQTNED